MTMSPLAGKPAEQSLLINVPRLVTAYYTGKPDPSDSFATRCVWNFRASRLLAG